MRSIFVPARLVAIAALMIVAESAAAATLSCTPSSITIVEGIAFNGTVATCFDSDTTVTSADFNGTIGWGDGTTSSPTVVSFGGGAFGIDGSHTWAEEGSYLVIITVNETKNTLSSSGTTSSTVADASLAGSPGAPIIATAGTAFTGTIATFADANPLGIVSDFNAAIDWGDGTPTSSGTITLSGSTFQVTGTHTWATGGTYTVMTTINDVGGSTASTIGTATVAQSLTVSASTGSGVEGAVPATFFATCTDTDPTVTTANLSATINWNDGSPPSIVFANPGGPPFIFQGTHVYSNEGTYPATITVTDTKNSLIGTASGNVTIADAPLTASGVSDSATVATPFVGTIANFTDANSFSSAADFTGLINWGDGTTTVFSAANISGILGIFSVNSAHTYTISGNIPVMVTINDVGGSTATTTSTITVSPGPATHFTVSGPASTTAGSSFAFTVTALDQFNNVASGYTGTAHFTSSDGSATLPANSMLTSGIGTFSATLTTAGNQTITATDTVTSSIAGTSNVIAVSAAAATHFTVSAPASAIAGTPLSFTVTAFDQFNNTATGYAGTVHFTSSDGQAALPVNSSLTNGTGTFPATLKTAGNQTITATDTVTASITGTSNVIAVSAAAATHLMVTAPATATVGSAFAFTVTAQDPFNNTALSYGGIVHFTSSDGAATLPANSMLTSGIGTFSATLTTAGTQTITATDTVTSSITGTSGPIAVSAAAATHFTVSAPASATAGTPLSFTVTAFDQFNNTATGYAGTVHFTSSDGAASLPANSALTAGAGTFAATLRTPAGETITATDTVTPSIAGTSATIAVSAIADLAVVKSGPASANPGANVSYRITVTNNGPSDAASVTLTDPLPAGTTFVSDSQISGPAFVCTAPAVGGTGTVSCSITTLPAGAIAAFSIVVQTSTANLSNTATVASPTLDPNPSNNSSTTATTINTADLSITKTASAPLPYGGQDITYTLVAGNAGPATATGVTVTDVLPPGSSLVSTAPAGICSGTATVTCSIASLAGGATATITLVVAAPPTGGAVANTATVRGAQFDPNTANNSSTAAVTLGAASAIPALSEALILLLAAMLAAIAVTRLR